MHTTNTLAVPTVGVSVALPRTLLDLAVTLRPDVARTRQHMALLAGRLGFTSVWLVAQDSEPDHETLAVLAANARPAQIGVIVGGLDDAAMTQRLRAIRDAEISPVSVEIPGSRITDDVRAVLDGDLRRCRAVVAVDESSDDHLDAAGLIVHSTDRVETEARLRRLVANRAAAGLTAAELPLAVALPVSIGRTRNEAEARALLDKDLAEPEALRAGGLFGTFEQAQRQVLGLRRAGADVLRVTLADEHDVADLLAQVRALAVGPTPVLHERSS